MSPLMSLIFVAAAGCVGQGPTKFQAQVDGGGGFRLGDEAGRIATVGFAVALKGWSFHSPDGAGKSPVKINTPQGEVDVAFRLEPSANGIVYAIEATPLADLDIESAHISFKSSIGQWVDGDHRLDSTRIEIPPVSRGLDLYSGPGQTLELKKGARSVRLHGTSSVGQFRLEDRRQWEPALEFRIGVMPGVWKKGETRSYRLAIELGGPVVVRPLEPYVVRAGDEWAPLPAPLDVEPGSALDWSPKNVQPAGSKGWLKVVGDRFEFERERGKRQKFYGANLCFSATTPDKRTAEQLARRLRMLGYNTVRLHHYDSELTFGWDNKGPDSTVLDPAALDRFDYLFAKLKENGLYVKIDLFTIRQVRPGEILPGKVEMDEYKALLLFHRPSQENWLKFTRNLLTHVNPYTRLAYKDDPALAWICPVNENNFGSATRAMAPRTRAMLQAEYEKWGGKGQWSYQTDEGARFGGHLHVQSYRWMRHRLRELGVRALLTDNNGWHDSTSLLSNRAQLDFVDNHYYWAHPEFLGQSWGLPSRHTNDSMIASLPGALANLSATRIFGKPFTVSELNSSAPNQFRAESGLVFGSLAALQDWDAVWRFAYAHSSEALEKEVGLDYFNVATDPANLAAERAMIALFLRGDAAPATRRQAAMLRPEQLGAAPHRPATPEVYSFQVGVATNAGTPGTSAEGSSHANIRPNEGVMTVRGSRTVGFVARPGTPVQVGPLRGTARGYQAAIWISSLDGQPVERSRRMLLAHVTDVQNEGARFRTADRDVIEAWGGPKKMVRRGSADLIFDLEGASAYRVHRLDMAGRRLGIVPVKALARSLQFTVSTDDPRGATLFYEIVRQ
ncbi:MAG TPA: hypothetical protein VM328_12895 [Fimbriimonadaceae bacterium]|nr:hypothetical protein [Fimbriimonadaceae bacterium]